MPHISFIQVLAIVWLVFSASMMLIGMRIAATPVKPYKPLHVREAEAIVKRRWKNAERKARVTDEPV